MSGHAVEWLIVFLLGFMSGSIITIMGIQISTFMKEFNEFKEYKKSMNDINEMGG